MIQSVKKMAVVFLALLALYAVTGFFVLPAVLKNVLQDSVKESSGQTLQVERIVVNPFTLTADLLDTEITDHSRSFVFRSPRARADFSVMSLLQQTIVFDEIKLEHPHVSLEYTGRDVPDLQRLLPVMPGVSIDFLYIVEGRLRLVDGTDPQKVIAGFEQIDFQGTDLATKGDQEGSYTLGFKGTDGSRHHFSGSVNIPGLSAAGEFSIDHLPLSDLSSWFSPLQKLDDPAGQVTLYGDYRLSIVDSAVRVELNDSGAGIKAASMSFDAGLTFRLQDIAITFDAVLSADDESTTFIFPGLSVQADKLFLSDHTVTETPVEHVFEKPALLVRDLGSDPDLRAGFELGMSVNGSGLLQGKGWFEPGSEGTQVDVVIKDLDLRPFQQYLSRITPLALESAQLTAEVRVLLTADLRSMEGFFEMQDLVFSNTDGGKPVLAVEQVKAAGIVLTADPIHVSFETVTLDELYMDFETGADGRLNLADWLDPAKLLPAAGGNLTVSLNQLELDGGRVEFTDFSLIPALHMNAGGLSGAVSALHFVCGSLPSAGKACGLKPGYPVLFSFQGLVNDSGSGVLSGRIQRRESDRESEIALALKGMDIALLSPYSARYLGRRFEQGTFDLDLAYLVNNGLYDGRYRVRFDNFMPGEPVQSPDALPLSLDMAVALLRDSRGSVDLKIPFSGIHHDDTDFGIGTAAMTAFTRYLSDIADKPFQELGRLLEIDGDSLKVIPFEPGSTELIAGGLDTLIALSEGLRQRPGLGLAIAAGFDPEMDRKALALQQIRLHVSLAASTGPPGEAGESIDFSDPKIQEVLDEFALIRLGIHPPQTDTDGTDREDYYKDIFRKLVSEEEISKSALESLARYRRRSIVSRLESLGIPDDRLRMIDPAGTAGRDNGHVLAEVELFPIERVVSGKEVYGDPG